MVESFKKKHENEPYEFVHDWIEIQEQTEKLITGGTTLTGLSLKAYCSTMDTLNGED